MKKKLLSLAVGVLAVVGLSACTDVEHTTTIVSETQASGGFSFSVDKATLAEALSLDEATLPDWLESTAKTLLGVDPESTTEELFAQRQGLVLDSEGENLSMEYTASTYDFTQASTLPPVYTRISVDSTGLMTIQVDTDDVIDAIVNSSGVEAETVPSLFTSFDVTVVVPEGYTESAVSQGATVAENGTATWNIDSVLASWEALEPLTVSYNIPFVGAEEEHPPGPLPDAEQGFLDIILSYFTNDPLIAWLAVGFILLALVAGVSSLILRGGKKKAEAGETVAETPKKDPAGKKGKPAKETKPQVSKNEKKAYAKFEAEQKQALAALGKEKKAHDAKYAAEKKKLQAEIKKGKTSPEALAALEARNSIFNEDIEARTDVVNNRTFGVAPVTPAVTVQQPSSAPEPQLAPPQGVPTPQAWVAPETQGGVTHSPASPSVSESQPAQPQVPVSQPEPATDTNVFNLPTVVEVDYSQSGDPNLPSLF